ncbi:tRNA 2-selenouridine(34) synthase MnmH [Clostridium sp. FP1]|uniref:tRNA 2-selenouridine(34) synthase MnmH n=1 Tax=Clostridium sp. FP1 TaxID=2724076 RepID=UPI0013E97938|nr:tRNA 2-selenouridine(34) synthase MnmH [Clostridium sp. FP1]MBZ9636061.1 tRNA 2-selenouridine(34) synthase MnmH [Clostridium sp. FP1]
MLETIEYGELEGNYVLVDVRSPGEFEEGTIKGAINIPLFDDEERKIIGTIYTRESVDKAKRIGLEVASKKLLHIYDEIKELSKQYNKIVLFCARGGMRSGVLGMLLSSLGINTERIHEGYKGYRKFVIEKLPELNDGVQYVVLHGNTGVGKTEILKQLECDGFDVLDLEGFANHRGSLLGTVGLGKTASQKAFESKIYHMLREAKSSYVFIEAESKRIGNTTIPDFIFQKMKSGIHIFVDADIDFRTNLIINEYTKFENCNSEIIDCLKRLEKYIGEKNIDRYCKAVLESEYQVVVSELMIKHYDPMYMHTSNKYDYKLKVTVEDIKTATKQIENWFKVI